MKNPWWKNTRDFSILYVTLFYNPQSEALKVSFGAFGTFGK